MGRYSVALSIDGCFILDKIVCMLIKAETQRVAKDLILRLLRLHSQHVSLSHRRQTNHFLTNDLYVFNFCQNIYSRAQNAPDLIENSYYFKKRVFITFILSRD